MFSWLISLKMRRLERRIDRLREKCLRYQKRGVAAHNAGRRRTAKIFLNASDLINRKLQASVCHLKRIQHKLQQ